MQKYKRTSLQITCILQCGTSFSLSLNIDYREAAQKGNDMANPSFHRFSSGCASCCNWRTRQAVRGFPSTGLSFGAWRGGKQLHSLHYTHSSYQSSRLHVLVELSPCVRTSWINFVSAVTSFSEIECETNRTALTGSINSRKSPRPREVAGGYIDT